MIDSRSNPRGEPASDMSLEAVQAIYSRHFGRVKGAHDAIVQHARQVAQDQPKMGMMNFGALTGEFCRDWPILETTVASVEKFQMFFPSQIKSILAVADTAIKIVNEMIVPKVCPAA